MTDTILVLGATGKTGRRLVPRLPLAAEQGVHLEWLVEEAII